MAPNNLGVLYSKGDGVDQDYAESRRLFKMAVERGESPSAPGNLQQMHQIIRQICPLVDKRVVLFDLDAEQGELNGARGTAIGFGHTTYYGKPDSSVDLDSGAYTVKLDAPRGSAGGATGLPKPARVVKVRKRHVRAEGTQRKGKGKRA